MTVKFVCHLIKEPFFYPSNRLPKYMANIFWQTKQNYIRTIANSSCFFASRTHTYTHWKKNTTNDGSALKWMGAQIYSTILICMMCACVSVVKFSKQTSTDICVCTIALADDVQLARSLARVVVRFYVNQASNISMFMSSDEVANI